MKIKDLRTQNLHNPIGISTASPMLSWKLTSGANGDFQSAYRIVSAKSESDLLGGNYIWDSGKLNSEKDYAIKSGFTLSSGERVYWRVTVWDKDEVPCDSEIAFCEAGLFCNDEWHGKWISAGKEPVLYPLLGVEKDDIQNSPIISRAFSLDGKEIASARLYVTGLGLFEAYINGEKLGCDDYFNPGESDARDTVYYRTYDITDLLSDKNAISLLLGNGQYRNHRIHMHKSRYYKTDDAHAPEEVIGMFGELKCLADIVIRFSDGTETVIGTDEEWKYIESPITENSWYGGEDYDATLEIDGWNDTDPAIPREKWGACTLVPENEIPKGQLLGIEFEPIRIQHADTLDSDVITVTKIKEENGLVTYLVDLSRNCAGIPELTVNTDVKGAVITLYPAEVDILDGFLGHINQESCSQSASKYGYLIYDTYKTKGTGHEVFRPRFCYHGYRYMEVTAPSYIEITPSSFRGLILRTDNKKVGEFYSSDESLNMINTLTERSIESNMYHTFTDCPQIEKLGWLETPGLMFYSMSHTYDISPWIPKIIRDMVDAQYDNGRIAAIAPEYFMIGGLHWDLNWNGSIIFTAWQYYEAYGDASVFSEENYRAMKNYMDYLERDAAKGNLIFRGQMGEWGEMTQFGRTPTVLVESTAYYRLAVCMKNIAKALGKISDAEHYENLAEDIKTAFHNSPECYNKEHLYGNGTQSSYGCVLYSGIARGEDIPEAIFRLVKAVENTDYHLTSGEVGLKQVFNSLAEHGRSDIVYKMVTNDTMPSYKYFLTKGLTTLPEYWNFEDLWGTVNRSRNHAMMGHVKEWFTRHLAGIFPAKIAYDEITVKPAYVPDIPHVRGVVDTVHGPVTSEIVYENGKVTMSLLIPVGSFAIVYIPAAKDFTSVTVNGVEKEYTLTADGRHYLLKEKLPSGHYRLTAT